MDPERKNKISVKDIVHKLKLRELCPISGYWYTEISGKRIKMAKELLKRLESSGKVSYVHIKNSGKKGDKSYYLCPDDVIEFINNWAEVQNEIFKKREDMYNAGIEEDYLNGYIELTEGMDKIDKLSYEGYTKSDLAEEFDKLSKCIEENRQVYYD